MRIKAPKDGNPISFDSKTPERIEERLDNLLRKPSWLTHLQKEERYFDEEDEDEDWMPKDDQGNPMTRQTPNTLLRALVYTPLGLLFSPVLLVLGICSSPRDGFWPLGCTSSWNFVLACVLNAATIIGSLVLLFVMLIGHLPEWNSTSLQVVQVHLDLLFDYGNECMVQFPQLFTSSIACANFLQDGVIIVVFIGFLTHFHRKWTKLALLLITLTQVLSHLYAPQVASWWNGPKVTAISPNVALNQEEIVITIDSPNLEEGSFVAWVPYWGCASTTSVNACEKLHEAIYSRGFITTTFDDVDDYILCVKAPLNPLYSSDYQCLEKVRLKVRDIQSMPGWSIMEEASATEENVKEHEVAADGHLV